MKKTTTTTAKAKFPKRDAMLVEIRQAMADKNLSDEYVSESVGLKADVFKKMLNGEIEHDQKFLIAIIRLGLDYTKFGEAVSDDLIQVMEKIMSKDFVSTKGKKIYEMQITTKLSS